MLQEFSQAHAGGGDIAVTRTLPARCYTNPAVLELEKRELFFKGWHYVGHISRLSEPGQYVTTSLFDQDIFAVRGRDGALRAFYNVCAHRGHRLLGGAGRKSRISCPYHAWTYDLSGRLLKARDSSFSETGICLSPVRIDRILDFVFVNLDPDAEPLDDFAPGLAQSIADAVPDLDSYRPKDDIDYFGGKYACNWKVAVDNFLECYHCETAHPSFADLMDIPSTRYTLHRNHSHQTIESSRKAENAAFPVDLSEDALTGHFWFLFPNTFFSVFPGTRNFAVSYCQPDGPDSMTRRFDMMTPPGVSEERQQARAKWGLEIVNEEDRALCESVQRGMHQRGFDRGYYLVDPDQEHLTEEAVRFFHRLYVDRIGADAVGR